MAITLVGPEAANFRPSARQLRQNATCPFAGVETPDRLSSFATVSDV
jgi:hypothetical protein